MEHCLLVFTSLDGTSFHSLFGWNNRRLELLGGMLVVLRHLESIGCVMAYIDGSFTSVKEFPNDDDACRERAGIMDPPRSCPEGLYQWTPATKGEIPWRVVSC